jgi:hypothetical protein
MAPMPAETAPPAWFVGAYPLLPKTGDRRAAYRRLVRRAAEQPWFRGLEVPFHGELDVAELAELLGAGHQAVVTGIPGVVARLAADPEFGLASLHGEGRQRAVAFVRDTRDAIARLDDTLGRQAVRAVLIHSSSAAGTGSAEAFARSLVELAAWDWDGVAVLVEHCDAARPGLTPAKGFLPLADEVTAIADLDAPDRLGILVNWGRSAIEGRDAARAAEHIALARGEGMLRGLMFSGCSASPGARGGAWADSHLPPAPVEPASILSAETARQAMAAAGNAAALDVVGMKIGAPADADLAERERILADSAALLLAAARD